MAWMVPVKDLDAEQEHFVLKEIYKPGNKWIQGLAGSGKSVLLLQSLNKVLRENPNATVFVTYYTHSLKQMFIAGMKELNINADNIQFGTYFAFKKLQNQSFDYIFCDEVQDLPEDVLALMKLSCKQLFISGDVNQSLYSGVIAPERISVVTQSEGYALTTIHRLTKSIVKLITTLMPSLNGIRTAKLNKKIDVTVRLGKAISEAEEIKYIFDKFKMSKPGSSSVVLLPSHDEIVKFLDLFCEHFNIDKWVRVNNRYGKPDYDALNNYLINYPLHYVGNNYGQLFDASKKGKVILMTYHSAKGLDFDNVYLPFLNNSIDIQSETLFMVALSRSKNTLELTYSNTMHPYLSCIAKDCHEVEVGNANYSNKSTTLDLDDFDF